MLSSTTDPSLARITAILAIAGCAGARAPSPKPPERAHTADAAGTSPWGPKDERGMLNLMTVASRSAIVSRIDGSRLYDLSVEYFPGMPSFQALGDPTYQLWLTHSPRGTGVDDPLEVGGAQNAKVSYTGDAISMYTHTGTHIDSLNHFGLYGRIYNGFHADQHLGDHGWHRNGAETIPPIVARGVMIDVAALKHDKVLPASYGITVDDLKDALARQGVDLEPGDVVLVRTGRMSLWPDRALYETDSPGLTLAAARWLAEDKHAMVIGSDALAPEQLPSAQPDNWLPAHTYLLAQRGIPIIEILDLESLSRDHVYEVAFIGASLRLRGASAAPFRPIAFPLRRP